MICNIFTLDKTRNYCGKTIHAPDCITKLSILNKGIFPS